MTRGLLARALGGYLARLRYPWLVVLAATLFLLDLFIPDFVPFADEVMLALATVLLASRKRRGTSTSTPELPSS